MLWLYILIGIILFFLLILLIPVGVRACYNEGFVAELKIGFVTIKLYPPKPKKPEKKKKKTKKKKPEEEKKQEEKPKEKKPSLLKEKGIGWFVDLIRQIATLAGGVMKDFFKHLVIRNLQVSITYVGADAQDTAVKYGKICSGTFPALSFLLGHTRHYTPKMSDIEITPDFGGEGIRVTFVGAFTVYPILVVGHLLWAVIKFAVSQIMITFKNKSQS